MNKKLHKTSSGAIKYTLDNGQATIHSGDLSAIGHFLTAGVAKEVRVRVGSPLSRLLKGWKVRGDWVYSSAE